MQMGNIKPMQLLSTPCYLEENLVLYMWGMYDVKCIILKKCYQLQNYKVGMHWYFNGYCLQAYVNRYILEMLFKATWCLCLGISITSLLIFLLCNHIQCIETCQFIQFCNWFTHNGFLLCLFNVAKLSDTWCCNILNERMWHLAFVTEDPH